jgi:BirA family biotin operon repressor/biotin-[acetyl-CoA-carboxylase] ligase
MVRELGVSRMAVSKHVRRLRSLGYRIESSPRRGYRLAGRTDRPVAEEVLPLLVTRRIGRDYRFFDEIASTNAYLRARIEDLPEGTTAVADAQSAGRGRFRRQWFSPPGVALHVSVLLKPAAPPMLAPQLALVAAAALLRALDDAGCTDVQVKWPNDLLWHGKKAAGILCEMEAEADVIHGVVIGMGVNVNTTRFPAGLRGRAASLRVALGRAVPRPALLAGILNRLETEYDTWLRDGLSGAVRLLNERSALAGREVSVALARGRVRGRAGAITDAGTLRIELPDGSVREIASGEVRLCRGAAAAGQGKDGRA